MKAEALAEYVTRLENEIAATLYYKNADTVKCVKTCIYHIILKAIAISKDSNANNDTVITFFNLASELLTNLQLDDDQELQQRLQDLINSLIDSEDVAAQLRLYNSANKQRIEMQNVYFDNKISYISQDINMLSQNLSLISNSINKYNSQKFPSFLLIGSTVLIIMLITITFSVMLISSVLTRNIEDAQTQEQKFEQQLNRK